MSNENEALEQKTRAQKRLNARLEAQREANKSKTNPLMNSTAANGDKKS